MKDKYVFDSSVWIEIERKNKGVLDLTIQHIQKNEVCLVDLIVAELLRGTKNRKDFVKLKQGFEMFLTLSTSWLSVANLAFRVARRGFHPPLTDLYIAQCVIENKKTLITHDKDFSHIFKVKPFELILI